MIEPDNPQPKRAPRGIQPQKQAPKNAVAVKRRRKIIAAALLEGKSNQDAGIAAGFSEKTAADQVSQTLRNPKFQSTLIAEMEKSGINDSYLSEKLRALIEGTKVISATVIAPGSGSDLKDAGSMSKDFIEVPDNIALAKGIEIAFKIRGQFTDKHEVEVKQPVNIIIRKFCTREKPPQEGAPA